MDAYSAGVDLYFADPHLGRPARYQAAGTWPALPVTVVETRPDAEASFGAARLVAETGTFNVRRSEVAAPAEGDLLIFSDRTYRVAAAPVLNEARDTWTLTAAPLCD